VTISNNGIKFTIEESKSFQGIAFLQEDLFQEYQFTAPGQHEQFKINFSIFLDCLSIFGNSSFVALQMAYGGYGHALVLM
jgi:cell cycle checkpoint protein